MEVCEEAPVQLIVNGENLTTFMCTPQELYDLAIGYLYNRRLISARDDILDCNISQSNNMKKIHVDTKTTITKQSFSIDDIIIKALRSKTHQNNSSFSISQNKIQTMAKKIFENMPLYKKTGGVHSASLVNSEQIVISREDIGRHNALDKVIGKALVMDLDLSNYAIITSGRIAADMILKIGVSFIPLIASRSIPSSLALKIAKMQGITMVGRILKSKPFIYTYPERIKK